jgi:hypothetical protein
MRCSKKWLSHRRNLGKQTIKLRRKECHVGETGKHIDARKIHYVDNYRKEVAEPKVGEITGWSNNEK